MPALKTADFDSVSRLVPFAEKTALTGRRRNEGKAPPSPLLPLIPMQVPSSTKGKFS
eukprot:CAMPEP_0204230740 /NCGR_PEP_ID=MMETSP0361-20130328/88208_1 /ASSEMBLY_ACC=CAM_ASM_000343 /TAXON_ID=268821 /ORGANISM="Scrippsiella Hangoei, Strain SHTV-5" /LENGTH=56 /DNA_ID=CAMNT_0051199905 /DNA_START=36 /DNA_END=202 /DNA_ORIENTATION=+